MQKTKHLTQQDKIYIGLKKQHDSFKPIFGIHRFIILKETTLHYVTFKNLKLSCATSDGNLAQHTRQMELLGLLDVKKEFVGKRPQTSYKATKKGLELYNEIEKYLKDLMNLTLLQSSKRGLQLFGDGIIK